MSADEKFYNIAFVLAAGAWVVCLILGTMMASWNWVRRKVRRG